MKTTIISVLFLAAGTALALPSVFDQQRCPRCIPSPNNCDITAPCANFVNVLYCACRPGYKAGQFSDRDIRHQWRIDTIPGHEHRVWVAPGVKCNSLCRDPWSPLPCAEVAVADFCAPRILQDGRQEIRDVDEQGWA